MCYENKKVSANPQVPSPQYFAKVIVLICYFPRIQCQFVFILVCAIFFDVHAKKYLNNIQYKYPSSHATSTVLKNLKKYFILFDTNTTSTSTFMLLLKSSKRKKQSNSVGLHSLDQFKSICTVFFYNISSFSSFSH